MQSVYRTKRVWLDATDAAAVREGEEVTLMDWGNAVVERLEVGPDGAIAAAHGRLHLDGSVKATRLKLTWLPDDPRRDGRGGMQGVAGGLGGGTPARPPPPLPPTPPPDPQLGGGGGPTCLRGKGAHAAPPGHPQPAHPAHPPTPPTPPTLLTPLTPLTLVDFGDLLTKRKLDEGDDVADFANPASKSEEAALGDPGVAALPAGSHLQLERVGYFRVDVAAGSGQRAVLFRVPEGKKAGGVGGKAPPPGAAA